MAGLQLLLGDGVRVFFIMGAGDLLAQTLVDKKELRNVDAMRTLKYASLGLIFVGPVLRLWFGTLDRLVDKDQKPLARGFKKMAIDQILMAPCLTYAIMNIFGIVNGESRAQIDRRIDRDYMEIMKRNYMLWPAAQMINFSVVPMHYQVTFNQTIAVVWNLYLSHMLNK